MAWHKDQAETSRGKFKPRGHTRFPSVTTGRISKPINNRVMMLRRGASVASGFGLLKQTDEQSNGSEFSLARPVPADSQGRVTPFLLFRNGGEVAHGDRSMRLPNDESRSRIACRCPMGWRTTRWMRTGNGGPQALDFLAHINGF